MKGRITAFAALATAALLLVVIALFAFAPRGTVWSGFTLAFLLLAVPIPAATVVTALGLTKHPAIVNMRAAVGFGAFLLMLSAALMSIGSLIALSAISKQDSSNGWAMLLPFLALYAAIILGGLGALCVGLQSFAGSDTPNWLAPFGATTAIAGVCIPAGQTPLFIAMAVYVLWWALLGAMLYFYKPSQAMPS